MKLLAIDSSTEACSVALSINGEVQEIFELAPREHSQRLLPMVDQILAQAETRLADLDAIAFGRGPGSFTGLRICLGMVQGLAFGVDVPVVPVSSLAALAQTAYDQGRVNSGQMLLSTLDARMDEIYWGLFQYVDNLAEGVAQEQLTSPEQLILPESDIGGQDIIAAGSGLNYEERVACRGQLDACYVQVLPAASAVARLAVRDFQRGLTCPADQATPVYLRDTVAWKKQK